MSLSRCSYTLIVSVVVAGTTALQDGDQSSSAEQPSSSVGDNDESLATALAIGLAVTLAVLVVILIVIIIRCLHASRHKDKVKMTSGGQLNVSPLSWGFESIRSQFSINSEDSDEVNGELS